MSSTRAAVPVVVLYLAGAAIVGLFVAKPKFLHGDSKRAEASTTATQALVDTTAKQGAEAAASVVKIGEANAAAPASPAKDYIAQEIPVALAKLPVPDPQALIEAERRKVAVLEGRVDEARRLYDAAMKRADQLEREKSAALRERQRVDLELQQVAAERLGAERTQNLLLVIAAAAVALWLYVKLTHASPGALRKIVSDLRDNEYADPVTAVDVHTTSLQQAFVNLLTRLKK